MLAFSNDYYGLIFRATQSVELFCTYKIQALNNKCNKKRKIFDGIYDILNYKCFNIYFENNVPWRGTEINTTMIK